MNAYQMQINRRTEIRLEGCVSGQCVLFPKICIYLVTFKSKVLTVGTFLC